MPKYTEIDLTPFFAPFFVMFFGLCLGDSGYGLVLFLTLLYAFIKWPKFRPLTLLGLFLGISTIIWGLLTGAMFGIDLFTNKVPILSDIATFPSNHIFYLALLIGLFQIFFGMIINAVNKGIQNGWTSSLSPIGWMLTLFSIVVLYLRNQPPGGNFKIGLAILEFTRNLPQDLPKILLFSGLGLILLFNDPKANIFIRFGKGLWEIYGITGVFGDLLSYIRLFALGISSAILGTVINSVGMQIFKMDIPVLAPILAVVFLIVGHTINILLACLGSFVHPLRLTFVEFYKNAGFNGGGKIYQPFKKYIKS